MNHNPEYVVWGSRREVGLRWPRANSPTGKKHLTQGVKAKDNKKWRKQQSGLGWKDVSYF